MSIREFLDGLPSQFDNAVAGRVLLLDGDFLAYRAAATVKTIATALRRFHTMIETERFLTGAETVRVHLTARGCTKLNRYLYPTVLPYQGNRKDKPKPPLLEPLRLAAQSNAWPSHISCFLWLDREADDALIMDAVYYGDKAVLSSGDKDLRLTPGPYWEIGTGTIDYIPNRFGRVWLEETPAGMKMYGHGTKFFWGQMLMGDTADNVRGILTLKGKACGPVGAYNLIEGITDESECAETILRAYAAIKQDPLAEAECLWLHRSLEDSAYNYFKELNLSPPIQKWLDQLHVYHEQVIAIKIQEREEYVQQDEQPEADAGSEETGNDLPPWDL